MTEWNERRIPATRMHRGCSYYVLAVILAATLGMYAVIGAALAEIG